MNLITQAETDLAFVLEDDADGFGVEIAVIAPNGTTALLNAQSTDIGVLIDPSTGVGVRGRNCEAVFACLHYSRRLARSRINPGGYSASGRGSLPLSRRTLTARSAS
jgi:hypothetical protein